MKNVKFFAQRYVDWVIKLGRVKFSLLGFVLLAVLALCTHALLSLVFVGSIDWLSLSYSILFGLISAPFVIYFFTLLVERLELSRKNLTQLVSDLRQEVYERRAAEERLAQASRDKTTLMATISHELRTPLNGIVGLSRMLLDTQLTDKQRKYLKTISVSAVSLGHIFNDIIDLGKIDGSRIELHKQATDLSALLEDILNLGMLMAEQKHLVFRMQRDENLPHWLLMDYTRVSQVLWNLMSNAIKFTEQGSVTLSVQRISENSYSFCVADTGQGIPAQDIDKIFNMYYQVGSEQNKHKAAGSGIGLSVSKTIAELMGGDLTVQSELGNGSTFIFTMQADETTPPLHEITRPLTLSLNVLLVEDIELNVTVARSMLEKLGHKVDVAMNGKDAIAKFECNNYDLVLLDIRLPDMTGFEVAQYLRKKYEDGVYDYLPPLVALTANVMQNKEEYVANGMDDVLRKPLALDALTYCLSEYFGDEIDVPALVRQEPISEDYDRFNYKMLKELIDMLGTKFVADNLALFAKTAPEYMSELIQAYRIYRQDSSQHENVGTIAHKIKGAAASVGLQRIQQIAEQIQHDESEMWSEHIDEWIVELTDLWQEDVEALENWINKQ
ncbi:ATP-binding protein [Pasteurellaceae bacterium LIM206]|nr:ATP-binding protein [Pasteurellaceae bacterium LIM206]